MTSTPDYSKANQIQVEIEQLEVQLKESASERSRMTEKIDVVISSTQKNIKEKREALVQARLTAMGDTPDWAILLTVFPETTSSYKAWYDAATKHLLGLYPDGYTIGTN